MSLYIFPPTNNEEGIVGTENLKPLNTMDFSYDDSYQTEKSASFIIEKNHRS